MTLKSGFFNSTDGTDHLYEASDFAEYLKGIVGNGCYPGDTGFLVEVDPGAIGANPNSAPSVIVKSGKAYFDGLWVVNPEDYVYVLGDGQQVGDGLFHLLYFCFDTNDSGRTVTIEHVCNTISSLVPGADGTPVSGSPGNENKYFMPIAKITDRKNQQPDTIADLRWHAGVVATTVPTGSIEALAVTSDKLGPKSVVAGKVDDDAIGSSNIVNKGVDFKNINGPAIMAHADLSADKSIKALAQLGAGQFEVTVTPAIAGQLVVSGYCQINGSSLTTASPLVHLYIRKSVAGGAVATVKAVSFHATKGQYFPLPIMAMIACDANVAVKIEMWADCADEPITISAHSCFTTWLLPS